MIYRQDAGFVFGESGHRGGWRARRPTARSRRPLGHGLGIAARAFVRYSCCAARCEQRSVDRALHRLFISLQMGAVLASEPKLLPRPIF